MPASKVSALEESMGNGLHGQRKASVLQTLAFSFWQVCKGVANAARPAEAGRLQRGRPAKEHAEKRVPEMPSCSRDG